jgi:predicted RNA-binding protein with PUA-like domain
MRTMQLGDRAFFYHSNTTPPGIVGLMEVCEIGLLDPSQFDAKSKYFDPRSQPDAPRWDCVRLRYLRTFPHTLTLEALRQNFAEHELGVVRRGNRLSILPVSEASARQIYALLGDVP